VHFLQNIRPSVTLELERGNSEVLFLFQQPKSVSRAKPDRRWRSYPSFS